MSPAGERLRPDFLEQEATMGFSLLPPLQQGVKRGLNHASARGMRSTFRKLTCSERDGHCLRMQSRFLRTCPLSTSLALEAEEPVRLVRADVPVAHAGAVPVRVGVVAVEDELFDVRCADR